MEADKLTPSQLHRIIRILNVISDETSVLNVEAPHQNTTPLHYINTTVFQLVFFSQIFQIPQQKNSQRVAL